jgi:hypothetical protein
VALFRRNKNTEPDTQPDTQPDTEANAELGDDVAEDTSADVTDAADENGDDAGAEPVARGRREEVGPFDSSEVEDEDGRLDLGALRVQGVPGMELRLEIDESADQVVGATAVIGESAVQLQAFAAPKTMGIWDDIRAEIAESIISQGGTADEAHGELGRELRTRMPSAGPDGRTVFAPARFAGVDGPRWFLRAVFSGRAAIDDEAAAPLVEFVRGTVVVRGEEAMAPREMLTLTLPQQVQEQADETGDGTDGGDGTGDTDGTDHTDNPRRADDLKPFERGPEITEVR